MAATTSTRVPTRSHAARQAGGPAVSGSAGFSQGPEPSAPQVDVAKEGGKEGYVDPANSYFECNICLELAQEPIVTQCGHLYCWSCIYKWLQVFPEAQQCPVCKAAVSENLVIPLYGRGSCEHPRSKQMLGMDVPTRPPGLRLNSARNTNANEAGEWGLAGAGVAENVGLMSTLLGFGIQFGTGVRSSLLIDNMSPEQQQQAFLSQLLLLLGSFVILCLLIF
mmetsp:Transcript_3287/g.13024  ORF Transcript_3287/g.13024 Transcript_3287/m.13024 type:complete len:222 (+) Transcript_3287:200-865(+)